MDDDDEPDAAPQAYGCPTIHIPLGAMKAWNPGKCAPLSLFCGPYAIILLAQTANTVLVPVLPFLITDTGSSATAYGLLQSTFWATETVLAPLLGALSAHRPARGDRALAPHLGRGPRAPRHRAVAHADGGGTLRRRPRLPGARAQLCAAQFCRAILRPPPPSSVFQIALFKAYFADAAPKKKRTGAFGLIGVIQGLALAAGPSVGGTLSKFGSKRLAAWLASALCAPPASPAAPPAARRPAARRALTPLLLPRHHSCGLAAITSVSSGSPTSRRWSRRTSGGRSAASGR